LPLTANSLNSPSTLMPDPRELSQNLSSWMTS
jgi:hypothetical protein